ncbi:MAG TPA: 16S rRNA (guanine(966)-N(2))-methyltransferase RsmD, partial [Polyangiaceae bacterium]|nr:16S rRNA (guanine(966)-N(2))-methyltransferase RsmD [Polyangiaceae bacterium]
MRIVAGSLGGRSLRAPRGHGTRPTPDRVREALFSCLGPLDGARVLDLYAGTGALGLEALSRGAARAVFVESAAAALAVLRGNVADLGLADRALVVGRPVERARAALEPEGPFDLVVADPPYEMVRTGAAPRALGPLLAGGLLDAGARVVLEHASADAPPELPPLACYDRRRYGDTSL